MPFSIPPPLPRLSLCTIRQLKVLAPLALVANLVYLGAVLIILEYLITHLDSIDELPAVGNLSDLPLFFGTVIFAFEGIAVVRFLSVRIGQLSAIIAKRYCQSKTKWTNRTISSLRTEF